MLIEKKDEDIFIVARGVFQIIQLVSDLSYLKNQKIIDETPTLKKFLRKIEDFLQIDAEYDEEVKRWRLKYVNENN